MKESKGEIADAIKYFERAADLYAGEEVKTTGNNCNLKVRGCFEYGPAAILLKWRTGRALMIPDASVVSPPPRLSDCGAFSPARGLPEGYRAFCSGGISFARQQPPALFSEG